MWQEAAIAGQFEVLGADAALLRSLGLAVHWFPSKIRTDSGDLTICLLKNLQINEL